MTSANSWTAGGSTTSEGMALWLLVGLELLAHIGLRHYFRKHHGG